MVKKLDEIDLVSEFTRFMDRISRLELQLQSEVKQMEDKKYEYDELIASIKQDKQSCERLQNQLDSKIQEYNNKVSQLDSKIEVNEDLTKSLNKQKKQLDDAAKSMTVERDSLTSAQTALKNRESFVDMEENRVKFLDRTLKALITDKDIKKKLESIGIET